MQFVIPMVFGFNLGVEVLLFVFFFFFISWNVRWYHGLYLCCKSPFLDCHFLIKNLYYAIAIQFKSFVDNIFIILSNSCLFYLICYYHHCITIHQSILLYLILQILNSLIIIWIEFCSCFLQSFISIASLLHRFFLFLFH